MNAPFLIWWIDQPESEAADRAWLDGETGEPLPDCEVEGYILDELSSRMGRAGRGRLWVPLCISREWQEQHKGTTMAAFDAGGPVAEDLRARSCGGIVIHASDLQYVLEMPGTVTNLDLTELEMR